MKTPRGSSVGQAIPTDIADWSAFRNPELREEDFGFRLSTLGESSVVPDTPVNEFEALMRCAPGDNAAETLAERQVLREVIATAIDRLTPEHRFIIDAINSERISLADLGGRLGVGKTQAFRLHNAAKAALREQLVQIPLIRERLGMEVTDNVIQLRPPTWNSAAAEALRSLRPQTPILDDDVAFSVISRKVEKLRALVNAQVHTDEQLGGLVTTIGVCAANMLSSRGLWDEEEILALLCRKQHDYGHANILSFGMIGVAVRDSDKVARWANLTAKGSHGTSEPAVDALLDMVGYAVIAIMLLDDTFLLELEEAA